MVGTTVPQLIAIRVNGTITLGSALPAITNTTDPITIDGTGQTIAIDGASSFQVLAVASGAQVTLNKLTISHGAASGANGGGIDNFGTLTVTNCTISNSSAAQATLPGGMVVGGNGGGMHDEQDSTATVTNSSFTSNTAFGGGGIRKSRAN